MKTTNELTVCEIDGEDVARVGGPTMIVKAPWNWKRERVVLAVDGKEYTVLVNELTKAIANCVNSAT